MKMSWTTWLIKDSYRNKEIIFPINSSQIHLPTATLEEHKNQIQKLKGASSGMRNGRWQFSLSLSLSVAMRVDSRLMDCGNTSKQNVGCRSLMEYAKAAYISVVIAAASLEYIHNYYDNNVN